MWIAKAADRQDAVTCPFCGLACDDLSVQLDAGSLLALSNGCTIAQREFAEGLEGEDAPPRIRGQVVPMEDALDRCTELLRQAQAPLIGGLATDVNGMRAVLALADRCGATLDHANGDALFRNLLVLKDGGWFTTTFTEVRNRADLILVVGTQCFERFPRLIERVLFPPDALFSPPADRALVLIGPWDQDSLPADVRALNPTVIPVALSELAGLAGLLRGLIAGRPVRTQALRGIHDGVLESLAGRLREARYSVVTWTAAELDFPHAELTVQALVELVRDLNQTTRSAALPLAGTLGDITVNQVCTWQTGYPLRTGLSQGQPRHEPLLNRYSDLLARGETDLLLWVSALSRQAMPPASEVPTILLSQALIEQAAPPEVQIPVGVPGIDHPGHWYRSDSVCPLPLGRLRPSGMPSVAEVLTRLDERLATGL
ncbi:MAG: formylmethanofuran dehydrogenase subunit B [Chromatiaceae bacterium]